MTGANGLLGQHLVKLLTENEYMVIATGKGPCRVQLPEAQLFRYYPADLTYPLALHEIFAKEQPEIVIHAAAMTQVDDCEMQQDACFDINMQATVNVLVEAEAHSSHFIYISTDFVFDGEKGNYSEEDDQNPVSWYGFTKVQAESIVQTCDMPWSIVRTCLVYGKMPGGGRNNIVTWVKSSLDEGKTIRVVSDQLRTPTYVEDLAKGILMIARQKNTGVFHVAGKDLRTPYEIALETAALLGLDSRLIQQADASSFSQPGKRPAKTGLDITKARQELGYEPLSFEEGLRRTWNWNLDERI